MTRFLKQAVFSQSQENVEKGIIITAGEKSLVSLYRGEKEKMNHWICSDTGDSVIK